MSTLVQISLDDDFKGELLGLRLCQQEFTLRAGQSAELECQNGTRRLTVRLLNSSPAEFINFKLTFINARWKGSNLLEDSLFHGEPSVYYLQIP